jgi:hypothetical protein
VEGKVIGGPDDPGFLLIPDMKWDEKSNNNLYCLGLVRTRCDMYVYLLLVYV